MNLLWPLAVHLMLALTGVTIIAEILLGHNPISIMTRASLVLLGSGALFSLITTVTIRVYQMNESQEEQEELAGSKQTRSEEQTRIAA